MCESTYKTFIHSLMEHCSPLWAGSPASHLSQLNTVESTPSRLLESSVLKLNVRAYHFAIGDRLVVSLSSTAYFLVLHPLLFPCVVRPPPRFLQG